MNAKVLLAGALIAALAAGAAEGRTHQATAKAGGAYAPPAQPIPYAQLDAYLKGTSKQRAAILAQSSANTGTAVNASATTPASAPADTTAAAPVNPLAPAVPTDAAGSPTSPMPTTATPNAVGTPGGPATAPK
jgi:hypothetical protein